MCVFSQSQKVNGICVVGPFEESITGDPYLLIKEMGANWIAFTPEAEIKRNSLKIIETENDLKWTQSTEGYIALIKEAKKTGLKVFLKPHLIVKPQKIGDSKLKTTTSWRGDINPKAESDWVIIEKNYAAYILSWAKIAQVHQVDAFCIGTELKSFIKHRPDFWNALIKEIKMEYNGVISYSSNWDNYENIPFWSQLDVIGVNCYFPIEKSQIPSVQKAIKNWESVLGKLEKVYKKYNKYIVITEFGYRNVVFSGLKPWTHDKALDQISNESQSKLLTAFFEAVWNKEWIVGGFLWNWNYKTLPYPNTDFSIQNKPAYSILSKWFKNKSNP